MHKLFRQSGLGSTVGELPASILATALNISEKPFVPKLLLVGLQPKKPEMVDVSFPRAINEFSTDTQGRLCLWLSPQQWLLVGPFDQDLALSLHQSDYPQMHSFDVTDKYQLLEVAGANAAALLSVGCSLDFRDRSFPVNTCVQTRIEKVPVIIARVAEGYFLMVERSLTQHLWTWLKVAAAEFLHASIPQETDQNLD